jgi:hypothetical protein
MDSRYVVGLGTSGKIVEVKCDIPNFLRRHFPDALAGSNRTGRVENCVLYPLDRKYPYYFLFSNSHRSGNLADKGNEGAGSEKKGSARER